MLKGGIFCIWLNFFDWLFTAVCLRTNIFEEKNFIQNWYYSSFGITGVAAFKFLVVALLVLAVEFAWMNRRITKEKAKNYYLAANLIFIMLFCFFFVRCNFFGCGAVSYF